MKFLTEYATPTNTSNPILNPRVYWQVSAFALTAVALLGIVLNATNNDNALGKNFLPFTWTHDIVHVVLAAAAFIFGYATLPGKVVKTFAIIFGVVYGGLGILGFIVEDPLGSGMALHLTWALNSVHLVLGAWALTVGIVAKYD